MKLLVVGGGGREHAIIKSLKKNPNVTEIFALPGNGGIAADAVCVPIGATEIDKIVAFAQEQKIDYAVVAPDDPLVLGCVDALEAAKIPCFGPRARAAIIEGSKVFSKNLMKKYGIPTARYEVFDDMAAALTYLDTAPIPTVIKADGLALGKGVIIAQTRDEAKAAVWDMMEHHVFGKSGDHVVIEEFLTGPEVSVLAFTDTPAIAEKCMEEIFLPTIAAMNSEDRTFQGCLYFGLMLTPDGPKVIEYNCRFGDPETQVVLPLLESDLLTVMQATTNGTLADTEVRFSDKYACCVITASAGYPVSYKKGFEITMTPEAAAHTYVAGAKLENGKLLTSGGRVTGTTAVAGSLAEAIREAYRLADGVQFENAYRRSDIGQRALQA